MSIPFLCLAIVRGVGSFVHLAGQMTGTSIQAGSSAATEATSGNFSYGNIQLGNQQLENVSQLQRNFNTSLGIGGHSQDTGIMQIRNDLAGSRISSVAYSSGSTDLSVAADDTRQQTTSYGESLSNLQARSESLSRAESLAVSQRRSLASSLSETKAEDIARRYNVGTDQAVQIANDARILKAFYDGNDYSRGTSADISVGAQRGGGGLGGQLGGGGRVSAGNSQNLGRRGETSTSADLSSVVRRFDSAVRDLATSSGKSELSQMARDHSQTLDRVSQLREEKSRSEQEVRSQQQSLSQGRSLSAAQKSNLRDEAIEETMARKDMTYQEAVKFLDSRNPRDQAAKNEIFHQIQNRRGSYPLQSMKQPGLGKKFSLGKDFSDQVQEAQTRTQNFDDQMQTRKLAVAGQSSGDFVDRQISQSSGVKIAGQTVLPSSTASLEQIKNTPGKIIRKVEERAAKGAARTAVGHAWDILRLRSDDERISERISDGVQESSLRGESETNLQSDPGQGRNDSPPAAGPAEKP
jgi:hypothetical protein